MAKFLFESYLHDRKQFVSITNTNSSDKIIEYGVPQGSISGPLLFLVYINDLPSCLQTTPRFFADDTALLITGKTTYDVANLANVELANVSQWMRANGLLTNTTKTEALLITPVVRKTSLPFTLMFNSQIIIPTESAKYLGITIDDQLSFKKHIALLENKIARSVGVIAKLSYYLPSVSLVNLYYNSLVHSHLLYASPVWASTYSTYLTKLKRQQNKALRIISKTSIRDRITPQYHQFEILKLEDLFTYKIAKFMYQFNRNKLPDNFNHYFSYSSNVSHYTTRQSEQPTTMFLPRFMTIRPQLSIKFIVTKI